MEVLRTPEERFRDLPGYPFEPHYVSVAARDSARIRMHYVDHGPKDGRVVLCLHGEPSWSYLYRKMIPPLMAAGFRVIVPDLVGFGRSDKPVGREEYTYQRHMDWMASFIKELGFKEINLFCQDWGGFIGLRLAVENPAWFACIVAANTALPTGDKPLIDAFYQWREFSQTTPDFNIGAIIQRASLTQLPAEVVAAYDAPFPDERFKAGPRQFPHLVPDKPDNPASEANRAAWRLLSQWEKPFLTAFSDGDPLMRGIDKLFQKQVPGAKGQPHTTIEGGGHFLQEDRGEALARVVIQFLNGI